jgi:copper(I)-binding protein
VRRVWHNRRHSIASTRAADERLKHPVVFPAACLALLASALAAAPPAQLTAANAWLRATPGTEVAAVYLTLHNTGSEPVSIVGVRSAIAAEAMIHETKMSGTVASMRPALPLRIAPGATVRLAPEGLHVMLHTLNHPLTAGEEVPLVLLLEGGGTLAVTARVKSLSEP